MLDVPANDDAGGRSVADAGRLPHALRRRPLERVASGVILIGVFMLMQPFALPIYTYSFITILVGTLTFMIVSHFPE